MSDSGSKYAGNDVMRGGNGDDIIRGHAGNDRISGDGGYELLYGDDVLLGDDYGANKADRLDGGTNTPTGDQCVAKTYDTKVGCER